MNSRMKRARRLAATLLVVAGVVLQSSAGVAHPELCPPGFVHPENSEGEEGGGRAEVEEEAERPEVEPWSVGDVTLEQRRRLRRRMGATIGGLLLYTVGSAVAYKGLASFDFHTADNSFGLMVGGATVHGIGRIILAVSVPSPLERRASGNALPDALAIGGLLATVTGVPLVLSTGAFIPGVILVSTGAPASLVGGILGLTRTNRILGASSRDVAFGVVPDWNGDGGGVRLVMRW